MTEEEWLACDDPKRMLEFLTGRASDRKLWLLVASCLRRVPRMSDRMRVVLHTAERYADGLATDGEMHALDIATSAVQAVGYVIEHSQVGAGWWGRDVEAKAQVRLVRELLGNPFRPVALDPSWLTSDVRLLAQGIYDEKAFDRMPILHDALMDAGCTSTDILSHCRQTDGHVRGCWAIDLLLGKS